MWTNVARRVQILERRPQRRTGRSADLIPRSAPPEVRHAEAVFREELAEHGDQIAAVFAAEQAYVAARWGAS